MNKRLVGIGAALIAALGLAVGAVALLLEEDEVRAMAAAVPGLAGEADAIAAARSRLAGRLADTADEITFDIAKTMRGLLGQRPSRPRVLIELPPEQRRPAVPAAATTTAAPADPTPRARDAAATTTSEPSAIAPSAAPADSHAPATEPEALGERQAAAAVPESFDPEHTQRPPEPPALPPVPTAAPPPAPGATMAAAKSDGATIGKANGAAPDAGTPSQAEVKPSEGEAESATATVPEAATETRTAAAAPAVPPGQPGAAEHRLAVRYYKGDDEVAQDYAKAADLFRRAALQGHPGAQYNLGILNYFGQGVPRDVKEAAVWFRRAAEQDFADAQYNLGFLYYEGTGVARDLEKAWTWFSRAAAQGHAEATKVRDLLKAQLPPEVTGAS